MAETKQVKVSLGAMKYEPPHVSGDTEFDGHGPDIMVSARTDIVNEGMQLELDISMDAKETKEDWSHFSGTGRYIVYDVADKYPGYRIEEIATDAASSAYVQDDGHAIMKIPPEHGTLVREFDIRGDAKGNDRPWVIAHFNEITLTLTPLH